MPTEPAAQPTSAPTPTLPAVTPPSSAPAPAGSNDERGLGSIAASITNLVTAKTGSTASFLPNFVHGRIDRVRVVLIHGSGGNAESAWAPVQPLADRFELVTPNRGGYPPDRRSTGSTSTSRPTSWRRCSGTGRIWWAIRTAA